MFLLIPMQRITRYHLLWKEIEKCTPMGHSEHGQCQEARSACESFVNSVNNAVRKKENDDVVLELYQQFDTNNAPVSILGIHAK